MNSNPLRDVIPEGARKYLYAIGFVALLVYAAVQAADGDIGMALASVVTSLLPLLAASNVGSNTPPPPVAPDEAVELDTPLFEE